MSTEAAGNRASGTAAEPKYRPAFDDKVGDLRVNGRYFTFDTDEGLVAGATVSVTCEIERPVATVWPYFKDHTLWQDAGDYYYSGVLGDLEGQTFATSTTAAKFGAHHYEVMRVIPEHLIIVNQPVPHEGDPYSVAPGHSQGGVSPGVHVFMLTEYGGKTVVNIFMEHRFRTTELDEDEALACFRWMPGARMRWRDIFIPTLKMLVYDGDLPPGWKQKCRQVVAEHSQSRDSGSTRERSANLRE